MPARDHRHRPKLSLHARRCGAELAVRVEARGVPAIAAVALLAAAAAVVLLVVWWVR
jgi:hypothetical protein